MKQVFGRLLIAIFMLIGVKPLLATVVVSSPANGSTVGSSALFTAGGTTTCSAGVAAMGVYIDNQLAYVSNGASLSQSVALSPGNHNAYVQEWDECGGSTGTPVQISASQASGVTVTSPADGSTVGASVPVVASATTSCSQGVSAMGVYVNNQLLAVAKGATLNMPVTLSPGAAQMVVQSWDACGGTARQPLAITVEGNQLSSVQAAPNWNQWGELAPVYAVCAPCGGVTWNMTQHEKNVSLSGNATEFDIGGSVPYSDVLWSNKLIGQGSTLGLPDTSETLLPNIHNLSYSADVYVTNWNVTQALEFDVNMYMHGVGMEWGTECNHLADGVWDIWDNVNARWVATGVPCSMNSNTWNHVTIQVQRLSDNSLLYQTITVNGQTFIINQAVPPFSVPGGWYGMTANYQMDGNYRMDANTTYMDNFSITYW